MVPIYFATVRTRLSSPTAIGHSQDDRPRERRKTSGSSNLNPPIPADAPIYQAPWSSPACIRKSSPHDLAHSRSCPAKRNREGHCGCFRYSYSKRDAGSLVCQSHLPYASPVPELPGPKIFSKRFEQPTLEITQPTEREHRNENHELHSRDRGRLVVTGMVGGCAGAQDAGPRIQR